MKKHTSKIWLTALLLTGAFTLQAQELPQPVPPAGGPDFLAKGPQLPPPLGRPGERLGLPNPVENQLVKLSTITGSVINPIANDRFEYNGLLVKTSSGNVNVMFPPHLGEQILAKAKNGAKVSVTGEERIDPEGKKVFQLNSIQVNGTLISDTLPVAPPLNDAQEQKSISSNVRELNYGAEKNVNGFTLSSGERVSIPPHIAQQLSNQLKVNEKVVVTGFMEPKRTGVVYSQKTSVIRAQTLNINGQTYLVR